MPKPRPEDPLDTLGDVYEKLYENIVKDLRESKEKTTEAFHKIIDEARDKAVELGELSSDDATRLADYLRRDLSEAINSISETGRELKDWLGFETALLETEILDRLLDIADPTTVELFKLKLESQSTPAWHTGEITGPGTLVCDNCGEKIHFYRAGKIPPCPKCHETSFHREISL